MNSRVVAALFAVLFWSTNALAAKYGLADLTVPELLTLQFSAAAITLTALYVARHQDLFFLSERPPFTHLLTGFVGLAGTIVLQYIAFGLGNILEANVVAYSWPLLVAVWAALVLRSPIGFAGILLALLGFYGVSMIMDSEGTMGLFQGINMGSAVAFASAMCMAFYTIASSRIKITEKLLIPVTAISAVGCFIFTQLHGGYWSGIHHWWVAAYIGIGPMAAGYFLWTYAMSGDGAKILAPIGYATPLLSTVLLLASGEYYTQRTLYGIALVLSSSIGVLYLQHVYTRKADQEVDL